MSQLRRVLLIISLVTFFLVLADYPVVAQKQITEQEQTWIGYFHQSRVTRKSGLWLDLHFRTTDHFIRQRTMTVVRAAYIHYFSDAVRFMGGYTFANRYNQPGVNRIPEHRPWQQLQWINQAERFNLVQGLRIEQRFRRNVMENGAGEKYNFNWRFRYNMALTIPLGRRTLQPSTPFLLLSNEIMVNAGKRIVYNYFDQNRTFAGMGYQFTRTASAHLGYLFIFQQDEVQNQFVHTHAIRLFLIHNLDFRNGKTMEGEDKHPPRGVRRGKFGA